MQFLSGAFYCIPWFGKLLKDQEKWISQTTAAQKSSHTTSISEHHFNEHFRISTRRRNRYSNRRSLFLVLNMIGGRSVSQRKTHFSKYLSLAPEFLFTDVTFCCDSEFRIKSCLAHRSSTFPTARHTERFFHDTTGQNFSDFVPK